MSNYLVLWPERYWGNVDDGVLVIYNQDGDEKARTGELITLKGGMIPNEWQSEIFQTLRKALPGDCHGPYWIVSE